MFSYIEKPFMLVDVTADDVVVVCDGVNDDSISKEYTTLFYHLLTYRTYLEDSLEVRNAYFYPAGYVNW